MKKALVTGAAGFIGSVLCKRLKEEGWIVAACDLKEVQHSYYDNIMHFIRGNGIDNYDAIFHLGAHSLLGPSVTDPLKYYNNNVCNMLDLLQELQENNWPGAFIFASSAATYGDTGLSLRLTEGMPGVPINPYGSTKLVGEMMLKESCHAYSLKAYSMRFFNVAGSYGDVGQAIDQPHILTKMTVASVEDKTFYINGKYYNTYDGTCVRDYIHVVDVCNAMILAANKLYNEPQGTYDTFNVCSGVKTSNRELVDFFSTMYKIKFEYKDVRPGDPGYLIGNPTKLETNLGFKRTYDLIDIINSHYDYTRKCL